MRLAVLPPMVLLLACSQGIDLDYYRQMDKMLNRGQTPEVVELVRQAGREAYGDLNKLLYHLDLGMALHLADDFRGSARQFEAAYKLAEDLYTKNMAGELASVITSDNSIPYYGEDFERVLIHVFNALNFLYQGDNDSALVEARRVDRLFKTFAEGRYEFDPMALLLSGLLAEGAGELDDAWISYDRAFNAYLEQAEWLGLEVPFALMDHWSSVARRIGRPLPEGVEPAPENGRKGNGEVVVLHYLGPGPRKIERIVEMSLGQGFAVVQKTDIRGEDQKQAQRAFSAAKGLASSTQITIAYPVFEQRRLSCDVPEVEADGCVVRSIEPVHNISAVAKVNLDDRVQANWGKIVSRAVVKFVTARAAGKIGEQVSGNSLLGTLIGAVTQAALSAVESADVRGWNTLPAEIWMTRLECPAGSHTVRVTQRHGRLGELVDELPGVEVRAGGITFRNASCY